MKPLGSGGMIGVVVTLALAVGAGAQSWQKFTAKDSGFTVTVPGTPKYEKQTTQTKVGPLVLHNYSVSQQNDTVAYMVSRTDYPPALLKANTPQKLLELARDGQINSLQGKVSRETKLKVSGHPALELHFKSARGLTGHTRLVMVKARLYQVLGLATNANAPKAELGRFVTSFALTP
jgi:hypothetical protein